MNVPVVRGYLRFYEECISNVFSGSLLIDQIFLFRKHQCHLTNYHWLFYELPTSRLKLDCYTSFEKVWEWYGVINKLQTIKEQLRSIYFDSSLPQVYLSFCQLYSGSFPANFTTFSKTLFYIEQPRTSASFGKTLVLTSFSLA